eukprot:3057955-Rhodomonas_salina.2
MHYSIFGSNFLQVKRVPISSRPKGKSLGGGKNLAQSSPISVVENSGRERRGFLQRRLESGEVCAGDLANIKQQRRTQQDSARTVE